MKTSRSILICCTAVLACAASPSGRVSHARSSQSSEGGVPAWVQRGSTPLLQGKERVFYGVGMASGIRNAALLRTTADNRARAEISKVLETFSASLMKDYSDSSGTQSVEQAIKTASQSFLRGVEVVDRYADASGALYALARLDLARATELLEAADKSGAWVSHTKKVNVDDIFNRQARVEQPSPPPVATGSVDAGAPSSGAKVKVSKGQKPLWVQGQDPNYPLSSYLCGVGYGSKRSQAENGGYAALSRVFEAKVSSASRDFMGAYSQSGGKSLEVQSSENLVQVETKKILSGVKVYELWKGNGEMYALACLKREPTSRELTRQIRDADEKATRYLELASNSDSAEKLKKLSLAMNQLLSREALNAELRVVNASGIGVVPPYSAVDVAFSLETAVDTLNVGVSVQGAYAVDFRSAVMEALTKRGYKVTEVNGASSGVDVLVSAQVRVEDGGKGAGNAAHIHFARGVVHLEVKNVAQNKIIASLNENRKEGHRSRDEAERRVVRKLGKKISNKVGAKIDAALRGG